MGITALHWAHLGPKSRQLDGQLFALWPQPVNADECFSAAGFNHFEDTGDDWDADYERVVAGVLAGLGGLGELSVHGVELVRPSLWLSWRHRHEVPTPLERLLWAEHDDNSPCRVEFGRPARAFVQVADGHEILWIWLEDPLAATWPSLLRRAAGEVPVVETKLDWSRLLPRELE